MRTLAEQALVEHQRRLGRRVKSIEAIIAEIDRKLTEQINLIMHNDDFQQLEGAWRGLHYLVNNTETDEMLKIRVMNICKKDLGQTLKKLQGHRPGTRARSSRSCTRQEYGQFGGEPFGCLVGDYHFDHSPQDVEMLGGAWRRSRPPRTARSSPARRRRVMQMDSWQELANPRDLTKIFPTPSTPRGAAARIRGLALRRPRDAALPRAPAVRRQDRARSRSSTSRKTPTAPTTASTAGPTRPTRWPPTSTASFKLYGWCTRIRGVESGGVVEGLPVHTFPTDDGGVDMKCPTEIAISDRREAELAKNGFMPLIHRKNTDFAAFIGAQSLQKPTEYDDPDATANANLAARLPYLFACCRFAHYLKCIVRDKIGIVQGARGHGEVAATTGS